MVDSAADLVPLMADVAAAIWGKPTSSSKTELRYGRKGSVSIDLEKGTWYDHEAGEGGGVLDALKKRGGVHDDQEAFHWLEERGLWTNGHAQAGQWRSGGNGTSGHAKARQKRKPIGELVATYDYTDEEGELLFQVRRFLDRGTGDRDFRQGRLDPATGDWIGNIKGIKRVPYRLPELLEAIGQGYLVFIPEGEKDVNTLRDALGIPATCNPMGAGKWPKMATELNPYFDGARLVIIADNDQAGRDHAFEVAEQLAEIAEEIWILDLARLWTDCPPKGDITDWYEWISTTNLDPIDELYRMVDELVDYEPGDKPEPGPAAQEAPPRRATPYDAPDPATIPKRAWLHAGHYIRQATTATVGPGGYGKTTLQLYEAIRMVADGLRVWYLSGEDPKVELDRRIAAHCGHHAVHIKDMPGQLFVDDRTTFPFFIAHSKRTAEVTFDDKSLAQFEAAIVEAKIDVVLLDPFVSFHSVPENDNGCVDQVVKRVALISYRQNCCIEFSHHVRKPFMGQGAMSVDDSRGGSAIINAVRSGRVINRMTSQEAETAIRREKEKAKDVKEPTREEIEQKRVSHIRVDLGKRNMAPPEKAKWYVLISVEIDNGEKVQALRHYEFPSDPPKDGGVADDTIALVRKLLRDDEKYREDHQSAEWLGVPIAKHLNLNIKVPKDRTHIKRILGNLINLGIIKEVDLKDPKLRKMKKFYVLGDSKRQSGDAEDNVIKLHPEEKEDD